MIDKKANQTHQGLKVIALLKVLRGTVALILGILLLKLQSVASLEQAFSLQLSDSLLMLLIDYLVKLNEDIRFLIGLMAITFGIIRYAEALGLWFEKRWAEWLAFLTSLIYIPLEVVSLLPGFNYKILILLLVNLIICVYLFRILRLKN